jgi:hypothetical protein
VHRSDRILLAMARDESIDWLVERFQDTF